MTTTTSLTEAGDRPDDSAAALAAVEALCRRMWVQPRLGETALARLAEAHMQAIWTTVDKGGPTDGVLAFLARPEGQARLQAIEHDLGAQAGIVDAMFDEYLERGQLPAPYFAMRVAILLASAGHQRHEMAFLASWCRHFGHLGGNATYTRLAARARRLGMYR